MAKIIIRISIEIRIINLKYFLLIEDTFCTFK